MKVFIWFCITIILLLSVSNILEKRYHPNLALDVPHPVFNKDVNITWMGYAKYSYPDNTYIFGGVLRNRSIDIFPLSLSNYSNSILRIRHNHIEKYLDIGSDRPSPRAWMAYASNDKYLYIYGGAGPDFTPLGDSWLLDLAINRWIFLNNNDAEIGLRYYSNAIKARIGSAATYCGRLFYLYGGLSFTNHGYPVVYSDFYSLSNVYQNIWHHLTPYNRHSSTPGPRTISTLKCWQGYPILIGGEYYEQYEWKYYSLDVWLFDPDTELWSKLVEVENANIIHFSSNILGNTLYISGGEYINGTVSAAIYEIDLSNKYIIVH